MLVKELKELLNEFDDSLEIMILDGFNGQGNKRKLNFGPVETSITSEEENYGLADTNGKAGNKIVLIGYGCY